MSELFWLGEIVKTKAVKAVEQVSHEGMQFTPTVEIAWTLASLKAEALQRKQ